MTTHRLVIHRWHPARLGGTDPRAWPLRVMTRDKDRQTVVWHARQDRIPLATGKRQVSLVLTLPGRQRGGKPEAYWRSTLDALVRAGLLVDDDPAYVERGTVTFLPGSIKATEIVLEDLAE